MRGLRAKAAARDRAVSDADQGAAAEGISHIITHAGHRHPYPETPGPPPPPPAASRPSPAAPVPAPRPARRYEIP